MTLPADVWMLIAKELPQAEVVRAAQLCKVANNGVRRAVRERHASLNIAKQVLADVRSLQKSILDAKKRAAAIDSSCRTLKKNRDNPAWKYDNRKQINELAAQLRDLSAGAGTLYDLLKGTMRVVQAWRADVEQESARLTGGRLVPGETPADLAEKQRAMLAIRRVDQEIGQALASCAKELGPSIKVFNELFLEFTSYTSVRVPRIKLA